MRSQRPLIGIAILVAASLALALWWHYVPPAEILRLAKQSLSRAEFEDAERLALQVSANSPEMAQALLIAGQAAARLGHSSESLEYFSRIPDDCSEESLAGLEAVAEIAMETGQLSKAEGSLQRTLECVPDNLMATQRLARLRRLVGRRWDARPLFFKLLKSGQCNVDELVLLGDVDLAVDVPAVFRTITQEAANDPMTLLWQGNDARLENQLTQAEALFRRVIATVPDLIESHAQLGQVFLLQNRLDFLPEWHAKLPLAANGHPEIWYIRGMWCEGRQATAFAIHCFVEALKLDPDHIAANYQLSQLLITLGLGEKAKPFADRANTLQELEDVLFELGENHTDIVRMQRAAQLTETLGRIWEAMGWCEVALRQNPQLAWPRSSGVRLGKLLDQQTPRVVDSSQPALTSDWTAFPVPDWSSLSDGKTSSNTPTAQDSDVFFADVAASGELGFQYFNSGSPDNGTMHMYEITGGGVAVVDYDADGWPDVYMTQGCPWPPGRPAPAYRDQLFRNLGNGKFRQVTSEALVVDEEFSQGATAGDFDNDGFSDLYVTNIGENRFYRNNGDGTVTTITGETGTGGAEWSTSCVLADLNGDTWPDLYVVNYLRGDDIFERVCRAREKHPLPGMCPPTVFDAEQDRCYLNLGDGRFEDVTHSSGIEVPNGKGLGVVAFALDSDDSTGLNLFVANDAVPNFLFRNRSLPHAGRLEFSEVGLSTGLALNRDGRAEAGMGIAAADVNQDSLLDFLVTNFEHESNTLYLQHAGGIFTDETRQSGLYGPSLSQLGFGTQFLDGNLDGHPDLFVANGHVDNYSAAGIQYKMRPQYFRGFGDGRFEEMPSASLGPWFQTPCLGRGVARLDWNRDGRDDLIVSLLDSPAALLSNQTQIHGHFLSVQLRGIQSAREAIGTSVRVTINDSTQVQQLTAGDGYLASNQRQLIFGLGKATQVDRLSVKWPSGLEQTFRDVAANQELLIMEGRSTPIRPPGPWE